MEPALRWDESPTETQAIWDEALTYLQQLAERKVVTLDVKQMCDNTVIITRGVRTRAIKSSNFAIAPHPDTVARAATGTHALYNALKVALRMLPKTHLTEAQKSTLVGSIENALRGFQVAKIGAAFTHYIEWRRKNISNEEEDLDLTRSLPPGNQKLHETRINAALKVIDFVNGIEDVIEQFSSEVFGDGK